MGRSVQKVKGALVYMGRRRVQGIGVIIKKTHKSPASMTPDERKEYLDAGQYFPNTWEICALVHWLKRPSEWENEKSHSSRTWIPLSWLRLYKKEKL